MALSLVANALRTFVSKGAGVVTRTVHQTVLVAARSAPESFSRSATGAVQGCSYSSDSGPSEDREIEISDRQAQKKYDKHGEALGFTENYNKETGAAFKKMIKDHVADPDSKIISGAFRKKPAKFYYNESTNMVVIKSMDTGEFVSAYNPTQAQKKRLLEKGTMGLE